MARILLGWEYGGGFGHVGKLVSLALALQGAGHTPILAVAELEGTRAVWEGKGIEVIAAPTLPVRHLEGPPESRSTLADTLSANGTFDLPRLVTLGRAWDGLLSSIHPDLVICEFAPTLAMRTLRRIPTITIGTGYSVPPAGGPFPAQRFWKSGELSPESARTEQRLLDNVNAAAEQTGLQHFDYATDLFGGDEVFVCCLPELDCYRALRDKPAIGSLGSRNVSPRTGAGRGAFAYLGQSDDLPGWLDGLAASGLPAEVYIRNGYAGQPPRSLVIHDKPADLLETLPRKSILFHHGGMSTTEIALRLGVPQLIVPTQLEQRLTGTLISLAAAGYLVSLVQARDPKFLATALRRLTLDGKVQAAARRMATTIAERKMRPATDIVVEAVGKYV